MGELLLEQGKAQLKNQDFLGAIATFSTYIQAAPYRSEAFYQRGIAHFKSGNIHAAVSDYGQALECDPEYAKAYYARALARVSLKNPTGAFSDSNTAIQWQPDFAAAYQLRGRLYRNQGERHNAIADFRMAAQFFQTQQKPDRAQDCLDAVQKLEEEQRASSPAIPSVGPPEITPDYVQKILTRTQWGETQQAMIDITEVLGLHPNDGQAYCCRGLIHLKKGDLQAAIADLNRAINLGYQDAWVYRSRSKARLQLGDTQGAIADCNQALTRQEDAESLMVRGNAYRAAAHYLGALEDYSEALLQAPENGLIYYERGLTYEAMGEYPQAIADYQRAMTLLCNQEEWDSYKQVQFHLQTLKAQASGGASLSPENLKNLNGQADQLYDKLLKLLGGNQVLADGMVRRMSHQYPGRSREWLLETVIHNLEQDMN